MTKKEKVRVEKMADYWFRAVRVRGKPHRPGVGQITGLAGRTAATAAVKNQTHYVFTLPTYLPCTMPHNPGQQ